MDSPKSETATIVSALRILSSDIISDDGVATGCLLEAAHRIEELARDNAKLEDKIRSLTQQGPN